jgi:L-alanine-DL-glutamate epimerase-like enolase superfamily enzyme
MKLRYWSQQLQHTDSWRISRTGAVSIEEVVFLELTNPDGLTGIGEAAPSPRYDEDTVSVQQFFQKIDGSQLCIDDWEATMHYVNNLSPGNSAAKGAVNIALLDLIGKIQSKPIYNLLGLGFRENAHVTSFSIGIDSPDVIRAKVARAEQYPILKLKLGVPEDRENLKALREAAPTKTVRVDGNEAWKTKEEALRNLEWLATDPKIEFIEQPMPRATPPADLAWLKARSPLPLMADESCINADDVPQCAELFHAVNVKLVKAGGISGAFETLTAARKAGLKTMLGCMIESSVLITAAAHLAELTDYLDLDGNILITNDPYRGATCDRGTISFANAPENYGLRVAPH